MFTEEEEAERAKKVLDKRKNSLRIFKERIKVNAQLDRERQERRNLQQQDDPRLTKELPYFEYG